MTKRSLRGAVILFAVMGCIWALVWAVDAFRSIEQDRKSLPSWVNFDIALGVLYSVGALIEGYGVLAASLQRIPLVRIYAYLSFFSVPLVLAVEILRLCLHLINKGTLIQACTTELTGTTQTVTSGNLFVPVTTTSIVTAAEAERACTGAWNKGVFREVAWLIIAGILGTIFALVNYAYFRQLMDPSLLRTQTPSAAYQMNAMRNAYGYQNSGNIPGYKPYQTQTYGDYVPPYDGNRLPDYSGNQWREDEEKAGYQGARDDNPFSDNQVANSTNPFSDDPAARGYAPPAGPPPGLGSERDEGFDPRALQAAMEASKTDQSSADKRDAEPGTSSGR